MTSTDIAEHSTSASPLSISQPAQSVPAREPKSNTIRRALKVALDLMVFGRTEGPDAHVALSLPDACREAGFTFSAMRKALERPHVQRYLREQKQVYRASASAQNISALVQLRDKSGNAMAQLGAIKVLEQIDSDPQAQSSAVRSPGFVIVVNAGSQPAGNAKPLIELHSEPRED